MDKSKKQQVGNVKPKPLPDGLECYADFFRNLPEIQRPQAAALDDGDNPIGGWKKLPYRPTEGWLHNAGGSVRGAMRLGHFKEYQNLLSVAFDKGGKKLWIELIKTLRKRAKLPQTWDYLKSFAEDCRLVADALEKENTAHGEQNTKTNRVRWVENPGPEWITNTEAIRRAQKEGNERAVPELQDMNPNRINKLLRTKAGCMIRFMSKEKPQQPRGRVHGDDWSQHLKIIVEQNDVFECRVEREATKRRL